MITNALKMERKGKLTPKPEVGIPAEGQAESITKSAISPADIQVQDKENSSDLSKLSTSPEEACQALEKIFDKKTVQEKQELAKVFGEEAFKLVGDIAEKQQYKALAYEILADEAEKSGDKEAADKYKQMAAELAPWQEGGAYITALHAFVGGIMSSLGGGDAVSGAIGAGVSEASRKALEDLPASLQEWGSVIIGATAARVAGGNGSDGASTALSGTINNYSIHPPKWLRDWLKEKWNLATEELKQLEQNNAREFAILKEAAKNSLHKKGINSNSPNYQVALWAEMNGQWIKKEIANGTILNDVIGMSGGLKYIKEGIEIIAKEAAILKGAGNSTNTVTRSGHAVVRNSQGRNVGTAINDLQRARPADVLLQDDGRWIIKGQNGRVHVLEPDGEIVTSMNQVSNTNVNSRVSSGRWSRLTLEQEETFKKAFSSYVNW